MVVIRPGAVSEVGQGGDILLAFAAMQETGTRSRHNEMPARGRASIQQHSRQNLSRHSGTAPERRRGGGGGEIKCDAVRSARPRQN